MSDPGPTIDAEREDKPDWAAVPARLHRELAEVLGAPVVEANRAFGGYGPSATFVLTLVDGRRAFFKGTYPLQAGSGVRWSLDREEVVYRRLGSTIEPWAPRYLGSVRADGWHALLLEAVGGVAVPPWTASTVHVAMRSYAAFHASTLSRPLPRWLSRTQHHAFAGYWRRISRDHEAVGRLSDLAGPRSGEARDWLRASEATLREAEQALRRTAEPSALLHFDTRSDNVRVDGERLRLFDWPDAAIGPPEFDLAAFAQSIEAEGGPSVDVAVGGYDAVLPVRRSVLAGSVVGVAGYFADRAPRPPVPGLPRLRSIQRRQLKASLSWAARLLGLAEPAWLATVPD